MGYYLVCQRLMIPRLYLRPFDGDGDLHLHLQNPSCLGYLRKKSFIFIILISYNPAIFYWSSGLGEDSSTHIGHG